MNSKKLSPETLNPCRNIQNTNTLLNNLSNNQYKNKNQENVGEYTTYIENSSLNQYFKNSHLIGSYKYKLEDIDKSKDFFVAYQKLDDTYCYQSYNTFEDFMEIQNKETIPELRRWNEIILENRPVPEYYDLDAKPTDDNTDLFDYYKIVGEDKIIDEFIGFRNKFVEKYYIKYDIKSNFIISTSSNQNKFSVHIVVRNGLFFQNAPQSLKIFTNEFLKFLKQPINNTVITFDTQVYSKSRNMRLLGNTKLGKNNFLKKHHNSSSFDDKLFLFSHIQPEDKLFFIPKKIKTPPEKINNNKIININKDLMELKNLLPIINNKETNQWLIIGQIISDITNNSDEGLEIFKKWSENDYDNYDEKHIELTWNRYPIDNNTVDNLRFIACNDNPEQYYELYPQNIEVKNEYANIVFEEENIVENEIVFNTAIDIKKEDNYYWVDFERKYINTIFRDFEDLKQNIIQDLPRVLSKITLGKGYYIKKEHKDALCDLIPIKDMKRIVFKYNSTFQNKKGQNVSDTLKISLDDLYTECKLPLYSHPEMIVDKNIKSNAYNIFKGIQARKIKDINIDLVKKFFIHIETIICNDNKEASHFFISWIRWIMVHPEIKSKVFVFLFSQEGYGKSTIAEFLYKYIFGDTASYVGTGLDSITGHFNKHLLGKLFCQIEELPSTSETFHSQFDKMKHYITGDKMKCIPKGVDGFNVNNHLNFLACSNNKYSLRMPKTDTRYFVLEITKIMDSDYWTDYYKVFQNQNFADMLYSYFLQTNDADYVNFNGRPKIPMTDLKEELIDFSLPSHERFYKDIMEGEYKLNKSIIKESFVYKDKTYDFTTSLIDLYGEYLNWGSINGERDLKRKYLEFKQYHSGRFRFIDLKDKITNIDSLEFNSKERLF